MSMSTGHAESLLALYFTNVDHANIGDAAGLQNSATAGSVILGLFTADPTEAGVATNECTYTGYARISVARSAAQWTVSSGADPASVDNDNEVAFAECTAGSDTVTHVGWCESDVETTDDVIWSMALDASRAISAGATPRFAAGELNFTAD